MTKTNLALKFPALYVYSLEIRAYAESSFANNADHSSQLAYVSFVADKNDEYALVVWSSKKSRHITRSVLAAELFALSAGYNIGYTTRHTLSTLL